MPTNTIYELVISIFGLIIIDCPWHALRTISVEIMRSRSVPKVLESTSLIFFASAVNGLWAVPTKCPHF
jgi:hypothetical protein